MPYVLSRAFRFTAPHCTASPKCVANPKYRENGQSAGLAYPRVQIQAKNDNQQIAFLPFFLLCFCLYNVRHTLPACLRLARLSWLWRQPRNVFIYMYIIIQQYAIQSRSARFGSIYLIWWKWPITIYPSLGPAAEPAWSAWLNGVECFRHWMVCGADYL